MRVESEGWQSNQGLALGRKGNTHQHRNRVAGGEQAGDQVDLGDGGQARGVIRNLLDGHYQGVADLRLRINFADELRALEQAGVDSALDLPVAELDELNAALAGVKELGEDLPDEVVAAIATVEDLVGQLAEPEGLGKDEALELIENLRQAFSDLLAVFQAFLDASQVEAEPNGEEPAAEGAAGEPIPEALAAGDPAPEPPAADPPETAPTVAATEEPAADQAPEPEAGPDPVAMVGRFLADWQGSSLLDSLAGLEQSLLQSPSLPPLSDPPDNHGAAHAKFLAIYEQIHGQTTATAEEAEPVGEVDAVV